MRKKNGQVKENRGRGNNIEQEYGTMAKLCGAKLFFNGVTLL